MNDLRDWVSLPGKDNPTKRIRRQWHRDPDGLQRGNAERAERPLARAAQKDAEGPPNIQAASHRGRLKRGTTSGSKS